MTSFTVRYWTIIWTYFIEIYSCWKFYPVKYSIKEITVTFDCKKGSLIMLWYNGPTLHKIIPLQGTAASASQPAICNLFSSQTLQHNILYINTWSSINICYKKMFAKLFCSLNIDYNLFLVWCKIRQRLLCCFLKKKFNYKNPIL